jgi:hypothetical protein
MSDSPVVIVYDTNGNPLAVQDGYVIPAGTSGFLLQGSDGSKSHAVATDGYGNLNINFNPKKTSTLSGGAINFSASGDNTIIAGVSAQTIKVYKLFLVSSGDTAITFKDGAGLLTGPITLLTGSMTLDFDSEPWFNTSTANSFIINSSNAVQISGRIYYLQG